MPVLTATFCPLWSAFDKGEHENDDKRREIPVAGKGRHGGVAHLGHHILAAGHGKADAFINERHAQGGDDGRNPQCDIQRAGAETQQTADHDVQAEHQHRASRSSRKQRIADFGGQDRGQDGHRAQREVKAAAAEVNGQRHGRDHHDGGIEREIVEAGAVRDHALTVSRAQDQQHRRHDDGYRQRSDYLFACLHGGTSHIFCVRAERLPRPVSVEEITCSRPASRSRRRRRRRSRCPERPWRRWGCRPCRR